jgi:glycosyltransferase involved in cell wall biosynthesis
LMIAYHYPPQAGSSGVQRTLKFSQYLPLFGWEPTVLTAHPRAYPRVSEAPPSPQLSATRVQRAFALDAARHLAVRGRYLRLSALPDRWVSWWLGAVPAGLWLARRLRFDAIWSTYPIATAHLIGRSLQQYTGIPWIADFRDPMTASDYPLDARVRRAHARIEAATLTHCARAVFTTPGAASAYRARFPGLTAERFAVIENGYDEDDFAAAASEHGRPAPAPGDRFVLLHSGIVYPSERDPGALFEALARLRGAGIIGAHNFELVLRASVHEALLGSMIARCGIGDIVTLAPPIAYQAALAEMQAADALLILQGAGCNHQIPAKFYEYLAARRPMLALTDPAGDTARAMRQAGLDAIASLACSASIAHALQSLMQRVRAGLVAPVAPALIALHSRRERTAQLARLFDQVLGGAA